MFFIPLFFLQKFFCFYSENLDSQGLFGTNHFLLNRCMGLTDTPFLANSTEADYL